MKFWCGERILHAKPFLCDTGNVRYRTKWANIADFEQGHFVLPVIKNFAVQSGRKNELVWGRHFKIVHKEGDPGWISE